MLTGYGCGWRATGASCFFGSALPESIPCDFPSVFVNDRAGFFLHYLARLKFIDTRHCVDVPSTNGPFGLEKLLFHHLHRNGAFGVIPRLKCHLTYNRSSHLDQLYTGFIRLEELGVIDLRIEKETVATQALKIPILFVILNDKYRIVYDTLDGLNWITGSIEENLDFFRTTFKADYYFKRSYVAALLEMAPAGCTILPLGFNYRTRPPYSLKKLAVTHSLQQVLRRSDFACRMLGINNDEAALQSEEYEYPPIPTQEVKILFLTRIWDPDDFEGERVKAEVEAINKSRVAAIDTCRRAFGKRFCGGITNDNFSKAYAPSQIAAITLTSKRNYLELVKEHAVCVATTGLNGSIGWKFAEYVAASRAIVSEPLMYEVPGDFDKGENYLEFRNDSELATQIESLIEDRSRVFSMMKKNYGYYNNYLKPQNLVLNTLLQVLEQN